MIYFSHLWWLKAEVFSLVKYYKYFEISSQFLNFHIMINHINVIKLFIDNYENLMIFILE